MKVLIFGAGASKGSQTDAGLEPWQVSPLVDELYKDVYVEKHKPRKLDSDDIRLIKESVKKVGLENWLTKRWEDFRSNSIDIQKNAEKSYFGDLIFYLWYLFQGVSDSYNKENYYNTMLKHLKGRGIDFGVISFNYDTLYERAYTDTIGGIFDSFGEYQEKKLAKPHGSINWFLDLRPNDKRFGTQDWDFGVRVEAAVNQFHIEDPLDFGTTRMIPPQHKHMKNLERIFSINRQYMYPLIFAPLSGKAYESVIGFEEKIISLAKELVTQADEIFLIGYSAKDEIINDILNEAEKDVAIHVVSPNNPHEILNRVCDKNKRLKKGRGMLLNFEHFAKQLNMMPFL